MLQSQLNCKEVNLVSLEQLVAFQPKNIANTINQEKVIKKLIKKYDFLATPIDSELPSFNLSETRKKVLINKLINHLDKNDYGCFRSKLAANDVNFINNLMNETFKEYFFTETPCTVQIISFTTTLSNLDKPSILSKKLRGSLFDGADRVALMNKSKERFDLFFKEHCIVEYCAESMVDFHIYKKKNNNAFYAGLRDQFSSQGLIKPKKFKIKEREILSNWINALIQDKIIACPFDSNPNPKSTYKIVLIGQAQSVFKFKI